MSRLITAHQPSLKVCRATEKLSHRSVITGIYCGQLEMSGEKDVKNAMK
jgi:hypothetical protein